MKLYFAGPLFTTPERTWNVEVVAALRAAGHEIFLPQEQEPGKDAAGIFATDVGGIDWADGLVAIMDGPDPDSGTCWEVGYTYGVRKPIVLVRTDFRDMHQQAAQPGLEPIGIAQGRQVTPATDERLLCGVLGTVGVAQHGACRREQAVDRLGGDGRERVSIAIASPFDQRRVHAEHPRRGPMAHHVGRHDPDRSRGPHGGHGRPVRLADAER